MSKERKTDERILRAQIIRKAAVDNMTNIAKQRSDLKLGIIPVIPERKTATDLAVDRTAQAGQAMQNLIDLGFADEDAHKIADSLDLDGRVAFNRAYPQIKEDFSSRFNVRNTTPAFFVEYLQKYLEVLTASSGVPSNLGYLQDNLITTPNDLLKLILTSEAMDNLYSELENNFAMDTHGLLATTLANLYNILPNGIFIANLNTAMNIDAVEGFQAIQNILHILKPLPSPKAIDKILKDKASTIAQKKKTLLDKLSVLTARDESELEAIIEQINNLVAASAPSSAPPLTLTLPATSSLAPAPAPAPAPVPAPALAPALPAPRPQLRFPKVVLELFSNTSGNDICISIYSKSNEKYYAIYEVKASGETDCYYGLKWPAFEDFLRTYSGNIETFQKGFHLPSLFDRSTNSFIRADVDKLLGTFSKNATSYNTKSIRAINDFIEWEPSTNMTIGTGLKGSKSKKKVVAKHTGLKAIKLGTGLSSKSKENIIAEKQDPYKIYNEELGLHPVKRIPPSQRPKKEKKYKVANGIEGEPTERYIALGKFAINMRQLSKGVLQVVYKSLAVNSNFNPRSISNELQNYLYELLINKHSIQSLYRLIPDDEKELFERLTISAGVFDKLNIPKVGILDKDKNEMERFKLLHGEFLAGNDNTSMIRELRNLILKFLSENRINKNKAYEYLLELNG